jgi:hypothetical protein
LLATVMSQPQQADKAKDCDGWTDDEFTMTMLLILERASALLRLCGRLASTPDPQRLWLRYVCADHRRLLAEHRLRWTTTHPGTADR